jgi:hypothetical protein
LRAKKRKEKERWNGPAVEKERGGGLRARLKRGRAELGWERERKRRFEMGFETFF